MDGRVYPAGCPSPATMLPPYAAGSPSPGVNHPPQQQSPVSNQQQQQQQPQQQPQQQQQHLVQGFSQPNQQMRPPPYNQYANMQSQNNMGKDYIHVR